jgi:putative peptidoglycan lipid II flippase
LSPVASRTLAATLGPGSLTAFDLGLRLFSIPVTLLGAVLIAPLAAAWSARYQDEGWTAVTASFANAARGVAMLFPPLVVCGLVLDDQVAALVFEGGAYSDRAVDQTASVLAMLLLGLPAQLLVVAFTTLFVVRRDTVAPMLVGFANVVLTVAAAVALRPALGLAGIALATSLVFTVLCGAYPLIVRRRLGGLQLWRLRGTFLRAGISTGLIFPVSWLVLEALPTSDDRLDYVAAIAAVGGAGVATHLLVLAVGGEHEVRRALSRARAAIRERPGTK